MAVERCADVQAFLPDTGQATLPTPFLSWISGAWVEVEDSAPAAWVITSLVMSFGISAGGANEIDIGVGAAGAEAVVASVRVGVSVNNWAWGTFRLPIPVDAIPSGARVALRMRSWVAFADNQGQASLGVIAKPLSDETVLTTTTQPLRILHSAMDMPGVAGSGTAWVWSAWVELAASTAEAWIVGEVVRTMYIGLDAAGEAQLGIGGAGSEQPIATFPAGYTSYSWAGGRIAHEIVVPLAAIPTGSRVAYRFRHDKTVTATVYATLLYYKEPL